MSIKLMLSIIQAEMKIKARMWRGVALVYSGMASHHVPPGVLSMKFTPYYCYNYL